MVNQPTTTSTFHLANCGYNLLSIRIYVATKVSIVSLCIAIENVIHMPCCNEALFYTKKIISTYNISRFIISENNRIGIKKIYSVVINKSLE